MFIRVRFALREYDRKYHDDVLHVMMYIVVALIIN